MIILPLNPAANAARFSRSAVLRLQETAGRAW
jgi:hypothetical protein